MDDFNGMEAIFCHQSLVIVQEDREQLPSRILAHIISRLLVGCGGAPL